jgi:phospholipase C
MMENRSFDHMLGWLPGANGRQQGLIYVDKDGVAHETWPLAPDFQGCRYLDPDHTWQGIKAQYADGRCDGFLKTPSATMGDLFPIAYYREDDLPILSALARGYTTFDNYFCSMMGPTWENRLYQLTATTQLIDNCDYPKDGEPRPVKIPTAIFDRVREAGLTAGYYYHATPITGLFESRKYDAIGHPIARFWEDAREGKLANVVFVDPDYSDLAEDMGTSNDYHPWGNVLVAEGFVAQVHDALKASPQWGRMVFVLNFDEHGGFFDHVVPPECQDDTVLEGEEPNLKRLGFRVPAIAMGPFAPRRIEKAGPYDHCSILRMIEWRWGLEPMTLRDRHAKNLAEALDFTRRREAIDLAPFVAPPPTACAEGGWTLLAVSRKGGVRVVVEVEDPRGAICSARLLAGGDVTTLARGMAEDLTEVATAARQTIVGSGRVVLKMRLTKAGLTMLAGASNRLPALLETIVIPPGGAACRSTSPALLRIDPGGR